MDFEDIIRELKCDSDLRRKITEWILSSDPKPLIERWLSLEWKYDYPCDLKIPIGYNWKIVEESRYCLELKYIDFDDQQHAIQLNVQTDGTPGCCLVVTGLSLDELY